MTNIKTFLKIYLVLISCYVLPLLAQNAASADGVVPNVVKFSGSVSDGNGNPLSGTVGVTFFLYKEPSGGAPLWMETQNVVADKNGHYSVVLGSTRNRGIPASSFAAGEARWIGVQASGQAEQTRMQLVSVPYALKAADAQTLGGLPASAFLLASPQSDIAGAATESSRLSSASATAVTTAGGTTNALAKFDGAADITSSQVFDTGTNVGIGTTTPVAKLDVKGASIVRGNLTLPATGTATAAVGKTSQSLNLVASAFSSPVGQALNQNFRWQAEPVGNNTASPSGKLSLLFGSGGTVPLETGLSVSNQGIVTFASGQTFPGAPSGTVTSVGLSAPSSDFSVSGSPVTGSGTLNLQWLSAPTDGDVPNAIVKRDSRGSFTANVVSAGVVSVSSAQASNVSGLRGNVIAPGVFAQAVSGDIAVQAIGATDGTSGQGVVGESFGTQVSENGFGPDGVDGIAHGTAGAGVGAVNLSSGDGLFAQSN